MSKRVLVIDDATTVRLYCRQVLEAEGYVVDEAINGIEGLEKALLMPPDLILLDVNMPKMDGYSMLHALRRQDEARAVPAVMISTEARDADAAKAYAAGANYYMAKPIRPDPLIEVVRLLTSGGAA